MKIITGKKGESIAVIQGDTHISKWVEQEGRLDHDQNMLPHVLKHIKQGDVVIDAGAFIGDHTVAYLNAVGNEGRVMAIEPNIEAFECLAFNTKHNQNCVAINAFLSDNEIEKSVPLLSKNAGASTLNISEEGNINAVIIDKFKFDKVDFIKLDIEGFEMKALLGAEKTIQKFKPTMLIEINRGALERNGVSPRNIYDFLTGNDYYVENIYPEQDLKGEQFDIICIHKSKYNLQ